MKHRISIVIVRHTTLVDKFGGYDDWKNLERLDETRECGQESGSGVRSIMLHFEGTFTPLGRIWRKR